MGTQPSRYQRRLAGRIEDPAFRAEHERARREIDQVDALIRRLDHLRELKGLSKAELARRIGRNPASIRRLFTTTGGNPELLLLAQIAEDLDAEITVVPRRKSRRSARLAATGSSSTLKARPLAGSR